MKRKTGRNPRSAREVAELAEKGIMTPRQARKALGVRKCDGKTRVGESRDLIGGILEEWKNIDMEFAPTLFGGSISIGLTGAIRDDLNRLVRTGLFGGTIEIAAERLLAEKLRELRRSEAHFWPSANRAMAKAE